MGVYAELLPGDSELAPCEAGDAVLWFVEVVGLLPDEAPAVAGDSALEAPVLLALLLVTPPVGGYAWLPGVL